MIDRGADLPVTTQCELLQVARSTVYYQPRPAHATDVGLMRRVDEIRLGHPFLASRRIADQLADDGIAVNRKNVKRLMEIMAFSAFYPKRETSQASQGQKILQYLLRGTTIDRPNQVWCIDFFMPTSALNDLCRTSDHSSGKSVRII